MAFFLYRLIKRGVQELRYTHGEATTQANIAAGGSAQQKIVTLDGAHAADTTRAAATLPQDPALEANWPRAKKLSHLAINALGLSLAIDFTMSLMSIQALYYVVGGNQRLYGLTFGSYDLTALVFAPLFGLWLDKTARYKPQAAVGILASIAGNVLYGLTLVVGSWVMMLSGRLVAGIGAALLGVGSTYISSTTTMALRTKHLARYRIWQSIARTVGPFVGYLFLGLPETSASNTSTVLDVFNWYTISGWLAAFVVVVVGVAYMCLFTEPTHENGHLETHKASAVAGVSEAKRAQDTRAFSRFAVVYLPLVFISQLLIWAFFSNLFALFAGQFHGVTEQTEQWKTFVGAGIGSVVGGLLYRNLARRGLPVELPALAGIGFVMLPAWLLVIPYGGSTEILQTSLFYAASGLCGAVVTVSAAAQEAFFSKKITQYASGVGDHMGKLLGITFMLSSAGRFAGPLIAGALTFLSTPSGNQQVCTGPVEQQCCILAEAYYVNGCVLHNAREFYSAMAAVQGFLCVWALGVLYHHGRYSSKDTVAAATIADK